MGRFLCLVMVVGFVLGFCLGAIDKLETNILVLKSALNDTSAKHNLLVDIVHDFHPNK